MYCKYLRGTGSGSGSSIAAALVVVLLLRTIISMVMNAKVIVRVVIKYQQKLYESYA